MAEHQLCIPLCKQLVIFYVLHQFISYRTSGMFGGRKVWRIWWVIHDSPNFKQPNFRLINSILMAKINLFAKLYFDNYFQFCNLPNINPAKHSRYTISILPSINFKQHTAVIHHFCKNRADRSYSFVYLGWEANKFHLLPQNFGT